MNHLDLFSGIGGFALATELADVSIERRFYSEIEPYAASIYQRNYPQSIALGDIRSVSGHDLRAIYGPHWFVTGGFPCQDISTAGKAQGIEGSRSSLYWQMHRLVREIQPTAVLIENVSALRTRGLSQVVSSLSEIGYDAEWEVVSAAAVGAPHLRRRLWIVAYPSCHRFDQSLHVREIESNLGERKHADGAAHRSSLEVDGQAAIASPRKVVADATLHGRIDDSERDSDRRTVGDCDKSDRPFDVTNAWPSWEAAAAEAKVSAESIVRRMDDGLSDRVDRVRALGNAIVPQVAAEIMRSMTLARLLEEKASHPQRASNTALTAISG